MTTTVSNEYLERQQWFIDRIGKTIFRNKTTCKCASCEIIYEKGLNLFDKSHAMYVHECEGMSTIDGYPLRYFDTIVERDEFESNLPKKEL